jgi:biopolymer transport protein ExbD
MRAWCVALLLLAACNRDSPSKRFPGVQLATSTVDAPATKGIPVVVVSRTAISLEGGAQLADVPPSAGTDGLDAKYMRGGARDMFIKPLGDALSANMSPAEVAFAFDASTPYRVVSEVLFTAGQSKVTGDHLLADGQGHVVEVVVHPPHMMLPAGFGGASGKIGDLPALALNVRIAAEGVTITAGGRIVAPGCMSFGVGAPTVPAGKGVWDSALLGLCVAALKGASPSFAAEKQVVITADGTTPWSDVMRAADVLRKDRSGAPMLTDVVFGVAR